MADSFEEIQEKYIEEMRSLAPAILRWWNERCPYPATDPVPKDAMTEFHRRWPAGPAAHPRIIAVFRKYFFEVEDLNEKSASEENKRKGERVEVWGRDVEPPALMRARPIDLLVNDLANVAPDLFEIMQGLVFVPIGMDPNGEVC